MTLVNSGLPSSERSRSHRDTKGESPIQRLDYDGRGCIVGNHWIHAAMESGRSRRGRGALRVA